MWNEEANAEALSAAELLSIVGGNVAVNNDSTFTYLPSHQLAESGGTDSFVVAVSDSGSDFHLHGLDNLHHHALDIFRNSTYGGHRNTATVTIFSSIMH